jgi:prefoldin subunit 5
MEDKVSNRQILNEVRILASVVTSLDRQIGRLDERLTSVKKRLIKVESRLTDVEKQTQLIPGMAETLLAFADNFDQNEQRFKKLEALLA